MSKKRSAKPSSSGHLTYWEKLKDPRWQRRRLEILQKADFSCGRCGDAESTLHVHHRIYRKKKQPWEYDDDELECLCEDCHMGAENDRETVSEAMAIPYIECFLVASAAEMINNGPLAGVLHGLKKIMLEGMHSYVPKVPVPVMQKEAGIKCAASEEAHGLEICNELQSFLSEMRSRWGAVETIPA